MRLTTKGRFAVTAMLDLAMRQSSGPVNLFTISERQHISLSYLEQLFGKLRKANLVESTRGPGGGYMLALDAEHISVAAIIAAVNESMDATQCSGKENCRGSERCMTHDLWTDLNQTIFNYLDGINLATLMQAQQMKESSAHAIAFNHPHSIERISLTY